MVFPYNYRDLGYITTQGGVVYAVLRIGQGYQDDGHGRNRIAEVPQKWKVIKINNKDVNYEVFAINLPDAVHRQVDPFRYESKNFIQGRVMLLSEGHIYRLGRMEYKGANLARFVLTSVITKVQWLVKEYHTL